MSQEENSRPVCAALQTPSPKEQGDHKSLQSAQELSKTLTSSKCRVVVGSQRKLSTQV